MQGNICRHIFWDWHGVLGTKKFWPRTSKVDEAVGAFVHYAFLEPDRIKDWMRNVHTTETLLHASGAHISQTGLYDAFRKDWPTAEAVINAPLLQKVRTQFPYTPFSIITDNMDVFDDFVASSPFLQREFKHIFTSAQIGRLKEDRPGLFEHVLASLGLDSFEHTLFLDDSMANCQRFMALGGQALHVTNQDVSSESLSNL